MPRFVIRSAARRVGAGFLLGLLFAGASLGIERLHDQPYPHLEGKIVNQVLILGNNRTHEIVFRREMRIEEGVVFRALDLWRDRERILDLGIFAHVEVEAVPSGDGVLVVVSVFERPRWFVTPTVDYDVQNGDLTLGYRFRLRNIGGMDKELRSRGRYGARDSFSVTWEQPWIGSRRQTLALDLTVQLPTKEEGDLRQSRLGVATTRFLGDYKRLRRGVTAFAAVELLRRDGTDPRGNVDEIGPVVGLGFFRDTRDVRVDPSRGTLFDATGQTAWGLRTEELGYWRASGDARFFLALGGPFLLAGRGFTVISTGQIPDYRQVRVGGGGSIRGQPTDVAIGNNIGRASLELRFPIFAERRFAIPLPLVPKKISNFDLRVDGEVFVDSGAAWNDQSELRNVRVFTGAGAGLRVFLPVFEVARLELAFDPRGKPSFYFRDGNII